MARKGGRDGETPAPPKMPAWVPRKAARARKPRAGSKPPPADADASTPAPPWRRNEGKFDRPSSAPPGADPPPQGGEVVDLATHPETLKKRGPAKRRGKPPKDEGDPTPKIAPVTVSFDRQEIIERLVMEEIDRGRATLYADLFIEYAEATANIRAQGVIIYGPRGGVSENPWVARRDRVRKAFLDFRNIDAPWLWGQLEA